MKNLIFICYLLLLPGIVSSQTSADKLQPELTPAGVYLNLKTFPTNGEIGVVERDKGEGFEAIGTLSAPSTPEMLYQRMQHLSLRFPDYFMVTNQLSNVLWQNTLSDKKENVIKEGIPVALLALGIAFLDTAKNLPAQTKYRIAMGAQKWESSVIGSAQKIAINNQIKFYKLQPAAEALRAEWRLKVNEQPKILIVQRKRLGIDSNFAVLKTDLGYEKTKKGDSLSVHLSDTTVLGGISYAYFLSGKDYFGRTITRSDTIRSIAGNRTNVNAVNRFTAKKAVDSSGIQLNWGLQDKFSIRSIRVLRSAYYDSTFVQVALLTPTDTTWIDKSTAVGANYYYQIIAQGDDDFAYPSPRIFGSFINKQRLLPPTNLHAQKFDGGAKLSWKYHSYMNLLGFRMYRSLGNSGSFTAVSDVLPAHRDSLTFSYIDKDKNLIAGEFYTYAVAAIGRNNVESPLSTIAQLNYAEKSKPTTPYQVRTLMLNDSTVSITWQDLSAIDHTISGYHVFRKVIGVDSIKGFKKLTSQPITVGNEYLDAPGLGTIWQYVVQAVNQSDSSGYSQPVVVKFLGDKPLPPGNVQVFAQKNSVIINWDGSLIPNIVTYNIYRASASTAPVKIGNVTANSIHTFEDKNMSKGNLYFYYVTAETNAKVESEKSSEVSIRIK
ncbi:hypothetical protein EZ428_18735 [Pedobacter frigiditerrae]|uniref:Fibronectin type-III domain-containing protein n=1 Tax=Pedobacter frigiditerrae TaxID=2530452 RepID=A0A4R0MPC8_9SPHI|nr:hypothetical protein [Pedobacter frigiditerrae]TCC88675.1 hypothetical protein EZ428_18735 [Pedobacter frigiditerrae]